MPRTTFAPAALAVLLLLLGAGPVQAQPAPDNPPRLTAERLADVEAALVRVELELQYADGEAPYGVLDQDPGSRQQPLHRLADVVLEERPLETTGFLVAPDLVVAMDPTVHPRFIRTIRVRHGDAGTTATVTAYGTDRWVVWLRLDQPIPGTRPLTFTRGVAAQVVTSYRFEGGMLTDVLPFPGRLQRIEGGALFRVAENQGIAIDREGRPLGLVLSRRLPLDDGWQGSPEAWPRIGAEGHATHLATLRSQVRQRMPRVRLSFRSPRNPQGPQDRFRFGDSPDGEEEVPTELDVAGILVAERRVVIPTRLRPRTTARLERITVHVPGREPIPARFEASFRDLGALVAVLDEDAGPVVPLDQGPLQDLVEHLVLQAEVEIQGENRIEFLHHARIGGLRVGPRLEPYPELADPTAVGRTHLFRTNGALLALPLRPRDRFAPETPGYAAPEPVLTPARLLAAALRDLPTSADPANVPRSEADEDRVAWLGTELQPLSRDLARANGVSALTRDGESGALVTYVHPESPAARAGIRPGAILLRLTAERVPVPLEVQVEEDGMRAQPFPWDRLDDIRDQFFDRLPTPWAPVANGFVRLLTDLGFGTRYRLAYIVDGVVREETFTVEPGPVDYESAPRHTSEPLGLTVRDLTYEVRRYMQRNAEEPGVVVSNLVPGSRASVAGLKPFEVITHVGGEAVRDVADFERLTRGEAELQFTVKRMAKGRIVSLRTGP